ncbi:MAG: long-chain-fatty-acid--CoA ligase [Dehalococcoidia bacterium]|nr:long-chain-fatty-acid--CoA ligase [Dehalococcoidia bacterium]
MNTTEFLAIASAICPDKEALVFEGQRITYAQLAERVNRLTHVLQKLGVGKGDRVAFLNVNCPHATEAYFATAKAGAIYVPLNFRARADELQYMIDTAGVKVLFVGERYVPLVAQVRQRLPSVQGFISMEGKGPGCQEYEALLAESNAEDESSDIADDDTTIIMYTAGTTGFPKGVMLTHNSFGVYMTNNVTPADPDTVEKNILTVPLYHIAGMQAQLAAIYGGRTIVMQRQFDAAEWMRLVEQERVDRAMMVPTMLKQLLEHPDFKQRDLSSLKVITYGAAPMPLEVIKRAVKALPHARFINAFGQTESASTITMLGPEDHVLEGTAEEIDKKLRHLSSIGKPMDDVVIQIMDEEGNFLPTGEVGEIVAMGPRLMSGYWKDAEKTQATIVDGWLHTGDLGYTDEDGYIYLAGRAKDMIKRGGEMVSPEEVENVLQSHPAIDEAAIIGVPDDTWGEVVRAIAVKKAHSRVTAQELIEFCHQRLASYKKPESVVFVDELPRNPMGKVLKRLLREQYGKDYKLKA